MVKLGVLQGVRGRDVMTAGVVFLRVESSGLDVQSSICVAFKARDGRVGSDAHD